MLLHANPSQPQASTAVCSHADNLTPAAKVAVPRAALHTPDPRSDRDALIAATAPVHRMTVVTRNTADLTTTGIPLLNPWLHPA